MNHDDAFRGSAQANSSGFGNALRGNQPIRAHLGTKVFDKTGVTGTYDFALDYVRDQTRGLGMFQGIPVGSPAADDSGEAPAIATALQKQLGLKLIRTRAPLDVIVIDQASKTPTEN